VASAIGPGFASHNSLNKSARGLCRVKAQSSSFAPQVERCEPPLTSRFVIPCCPQLSPGAAELRPQRGPPRLNCRSDYAALLIHSRTRVRYAGPAGTWHDLDLGRPIAAPLEQCAELLGVDLATVGELAAKGGAVPPRRRHQDLEPDAA
jgi:hypothetical protein